ncbi:MAG: alpha/beta hydrolase [Myxococcales bacterium]|nr:alpha/beta hydrolase [Myxococcales bacterium]
MTRRMWQQQSSVFALGICLLSGCPGLRIHEAEKQVRILQDLPYVPESQDPKQQLDLYLPRDKRDVPVVVFVHGGFWRNQDRRYHQAFTGLHGNIGVALAKRGISVAIPSYRLLPSASLSDQLSDVRDAVRFVATHAGEYGWNPQRLVLAGFSAGGHLVYSLCVDAERLKLPSGSQLRGCISISGVLDIVRMASQQDAAFNQEVTQRHFGMTKESQQSLSPLFQMSGKMPPLLLLWAEKDHPFVRQAGYDAVEKVAKLGIPARSFELSDHDHADMVLRLNSASDQVSDKLAAFVLDVTK